MRLDNQDFGKIEKSAEELAFLEKAKSFSEEDKWKLDLEIGKRTKIEAPQNFVSVFHSTPNKNLESIDKNGITFDKKNECFQHILHEIIDEYKPNNFKNNISRTNHYAAVDLYSNNFGALKKYRNLDLTFEDYKKNSADWEWLSENEIFTDSDFEKKIKNKKKLRSQDSLREVLELKIDPKKSIVGNMSAITDLYNILMNDGRSINLDEKDRIEKELKDYWENNTVSLEDFLKYYSRPKKLYKDWQVRNPEIFKDSRINNRISPDSEYFLLKDAPDNLPNSINKPEVYIPEDTPPEHIMIIE